MTGAVQIGRLIGLQATRFVFKPSSAGERSVTGTVGGSSLMILFRQSI